MLANALLFQYALPNQQQRMEEVTPHLDAVYGAAWPSEIDLDTLNIDSFDHCVIGQLTKGDAQVGLFGTSFITGMRMMRQHLRAEASMELYDADRTLDVFRSGAITELWKEYIISLREQRGLA